TAISTTLEGGTEVVKSGGIVSGIVTFVGGGELTLDLSTGPNNFELAGFTATSDKLDLADIGYGAGTTVHFSEASDDKSGTLTVSYGTHIATITLLGDFTHSTFILSSDGNGGTIVVDPPQSDSSATTSSPVASVALTGHDSFVFKPDLGVVASSNVASGPLSIFETDQLHMASGEASAQALLH